MRPELVVEVRYDKVQGNRFRHGTTLPPLPRRQGPEGLHVARSAARAEPERPDVRVAARYFFLAREGCTRFGSPGIFGNCGGYGASPTPSLLVALDPLEELSQVAHGVVDPGLHVAELRRSAPASSRS